MTAFDPAQLGQAIGALVTVLGLLLVVGWALRLVRGRLVATASTRLAVTETLVLDNRHRLVRVTDGDSEHVLLLGPTSAGVVASQRLPAAPGGVIAEAAE
ncbi:MAG: hypothetical protein AAFX81_10365 [Pseudomonadota bacterium]